MSSNSPHYHPLVIIIHPLNHHIITLMCPLITLQHHTLLLAERALSRDYPCKCGLQKHYLTASRARAIIHYCMFSKIVLGSTILFLTENFKRQL